MRATGFAVVGLCLTLFSGCLCGCGADDAPTPVDRVTAETTSPSSGPPPPRSTGAGTAADGSPDAASSESPSTPAPSQAPTTLGPDASLTSAYCDAILTLVSLERPADGPVTPDHEARYQTLLQAVIDESPPEHAPTWELFLVLVEEPFTYENFNPAVDSLDEIGPELTGRCPGTEWMIVDDDGRLTTWSVTDDG